MIALGAAAGNGTADAAGDVDSLAAPMEHLAAWMDLFLLRRPSLLFEQRAGLELAELMGSPVYYGAGIPRGDGTHVLLIPGFMGSDSYMSVLAGWLRRIGYTPHPSGLSFNAGRPYDLLAHLLRRLEEIAHVVGRRITIIGHSLGGVFARILVRLRPDLVEHVIALGSPLTMDPRRAAHPLVGAMADVLLREGHRPHEVTSQRQVEHELRGGPLPDTVRLTSLYSREDAVVQWRACLDLDPRATCHEVRGSHIGLAWNARVYGHLGRALLLEM